MRAALVLALLLRLSPGYERPWVVRAAMAVAGAARGPREACALATIVFYENGLHGRGVWFGVTAAAPRHYATPRLAARTALRILRRAGRACGPRQPIEARFRYFHTGSCGGVDPYAARQARTFARLLLAARELGAGR